MSEQNISIKVDPQLKAALRKIATKEQRSLSNLVRIFLQQGVYTQRARAHTKVA